MYRFKSKKKNKKKINSTLSYQLHAHFKTPPQVSFKRGFCRWAWYLHMKLKIFYFLLVQKLLRTCVFPLLSVDLHFWLHWGRNYQFLGEATFCYLIFVSNVEASTLYTMIFCESILLCCSCFLFLFFFQYGKQQCYSHIWFASKSVFYPLWFVVMLVINQRGGCLLAFSIFLLLEKYFFLKETSSFQFL